MREASRACSDRLGTPLARTCRTPNVRFRLRLPARETRLRVLPTPSLGHWGFDAEPLVERLQHIRSRSPFAHRRAVDRLADLYDARGLNRPLRLVKGKARVVPGQAAEIDDPPGLPF